MFIEVTEKTTGAKKLLNRNGIAAIADYGGHCSICLQYYSDAIITNETYEEIKEMLCPTFIGKEFRTGGPIDIRTTLSGMPEKGDEEIKCK